MVLEIKREDLIRIGADHFEALYEDDGWEDFLQIYVERENPDLVQAAMDDAQDSTLDQLQFLTESVERDLVIDICAEIIRRQMSALTELTRDISVPG